MKVYQLIDQFGCVRGTYLKRIWAMMDKNAMVKLEVPLSATVRIKEVEVRDEPYYARRIAGHLQAHKETKLGNG